MVVLLLATLVTLAILVMVGEDLAVLGVNLERLETAPLSATPLSRWR